MLFSLIIIFIYVSFRFEWKYAVPVMIALGHDILLTIGIYSLSGRVVTADTIAAVLTVLGYSMYDTVIVFDRVRENIPILRRNTASQVVNESLAETITRSLNTSLVTLIPVVLLFVFGSGSLKDFAFALVVGIASGAYSSIFIAAPLLAIFLEREPGFHEAARRPRQIRRARNPSGRRRRPRRPCLWPRSPADPDTASAAAAHPEASPPGPRPHSLTTLLARLPVKFRPARPISPVPMRAGRVPADRRFWDLIAVIKATGALRSAGDASEAMAIFARELTLLFDASACLISTFDPNTQMVTDWAAHVVPPAKLNVAAEDYPLEDYPTTRRVCHRARRGIDHDR